MHRKDSLKTQKKRILILKRKKEKKNKADKIFRNAFIEIKSRRNHAFYLSFLRCHIEMTSSQNGGLLPTPTLPNVIKKSEKKYFWETFQHGS